MQALGRVRSWWTQRECLYARSSRGDLQRSWTESFVADSPFGYLGGAVVCLSAAEQDATVALLVATLAKVRAGAAAAISLVPACRAAWRSWT